VIHLNERPPSSIILSFPVAHEVQSVSAGPVQVLHDELQAGHTDFVRHELS